MSVVTAGQRGLKGVRGFRQPNILAEELENWL